MVDESVNVYSSNNINISIMSVNTRIHIYILYDRQTEISRFQKIEQPVLFVPQFDDKNVLDHKDSL